MARPALTIEGLSELIAQEVERQVSVRLERRSPWLTTEEAAEYLRCPASRVYKLASRRAIPVHKDGRRSLYRCDELDAFIAAGGAEC
jgi:excisionase family DNA binding protein